MKTFEESFSEKKLSWMDRQRAQLWFEVGSREGRKKPISGYDHIKKTPFKKKELEEMHWVELAEKVAQVQDQHNYSERELAKKFDISKSEIHRLLVLARLDKALLDKARNWPIEKYVLLEWAELDEGVFKEQLYHMIKSGKLQKRWQLKTLIEQRQDKR